MARRPTPPQYNKGEWAELYVLGKLLCEKKISVGKFSTTESTRDLEILKISRSSTSDEEFGIDGAEVILSASRSRIHTSELCDLTSRFFPEIVVGNWVFVSDTGMKLLNLLEIENLKLGNEKSDLFLSIRDPLTGVSGRQGYTVKSFVGSTPTLLNAGATTNFTFKITPRVPDSLIEILHSLPIRKMFLRLRTDGFHLDLIDIQKEFKNNLSMVDSRMIEVLTHFLVAYYSMECGADTRISTAVDHISTVNPMNVNNPLVFYRHKMKDFLEAVAYGLTPSRPWDGIRTAPGGLILVEKSGDITCLPSGSSDDHREFLLQSTKFETPSRTRHGFGRILQTEFGSVVKLNLQIRYT